MQHGFVGGCCLLGRASVKARPVSFRHVCSRNALNHFTTARYYDSCRMLVVEGKVSATLTALCAAILAQGPVGLEGWFYERYTYTLCLCVCASCIPGLGFGCG